MVTENQKLKKEIEELNRLKLFAYESSSYLDEYDKSCYDLITDHIRNIEHSYFNIINSVNINGEVRDNFLSEHEKISKEYFNLKTDKLIFKLVSIGDLLITTTKWIYFNSKKKIKFIDMNDEILKYNILKESFRNNKETLLQILNRRDIKYHDLEKETKHKHFLRDNKNLKKKEEKTQISKKTFKKKERLTVFQKIQNEAFIELRIELYNQNIHPNVYIDKENKRFIMKKQINKKEISFKKYFKEINTEQDYWLMLFHWNKMLADKNYDEARKWLNNEFDKKIVSLDLTEE